MPLLGFRPESTTGALLLVVGKEMAIGAQGSNLQPDYRCIFHIELLDFFCIHQVINYFCKKPPGNGRCGGGKQVSKAFNATSYRGF